MPRYDYHCDACRAEFETVQSIHDESLTDCPHCHEQQLRRIVSGAGVIFKGSGFYTNDSKKTDTGATSDSAAATSSNTTASTSSTAGSES